MSARELPAFERPSIEQARLILTASDALDVGEASREELAAMYGRLQAAVEMLLPVQAPARAVAA